MQKLSDVSDCLFLSVLWIICCLPLITVGASTTALYFASFRAVREEGTIAKDFFRSFRSNFLQATLIELILLIPIGVLFVDARFFLSRDGFVEKVVVWAVTALFAAWLGYVFPLLARFEYKVRTLFKTALLMAIANPKATVKLTFINLLPLILFFLFPQAIYRFFPIFLGFAPALIARLNARTLLGVFARYTPEEGAAAEAGEGA